MPPRTRRLRRHQPPTGPVSSGPLGGSDQTTGSAVGSVSTVEREPEDPFAADRFSVDLEDEDRRGDPSAPDLAPSEAAADPTTSPWRLLLRLGLIVALTVVTFHHSVGSLLQSVAAGSVVAYVLAVPLYAGLASAALARRPGYRPAAGVRLPDVLLGTALCGLSLGLTSLLGPGLSGVYGLWRADLLTLWLFFLGTSVLGFGLRQTGRQWAFWLVLLLMWPFPLRLLNTSVSSSLPGAILLAVVVLAVVAYGHRPDDPPRWQVLGSAATAAALVGLLSAIETHPARLVWPSLAAAVVGVGWWASRVHRRAPERLVEPRTRGTYVILVGLALVGLVVLPPAPVPAPLSTPTGITALALGPLEVPGFATTETGWVTREQGRFGHGSTWQRTALRQVGTSADQPGTGRALVVDVISTGRPQTLTLYPVVTTYPMGTLSSRPDARVNLGHGVDAQLFRGDDARDQIGYTLLTFAWRLPVDMAMTDGYSGPPAQLTQRITLIAVDDQGLGARFPQPGNAATDGLRSVLSGSWPGRSQVGPVLPGDQRLLTDAARALVERRLTGG